MPAQSRGGVTLEGVAEHAAAQILKHLLLIGIVGLVRHTQPGLVNVEGVVAPVRVVECKRLLAVLRVTDVPDVGLVFGHLNAELRPPVYLTARHVLSRGA